MSNKIEVDRDRIEAWAERFSKAQMFKESSELRDLLAHHIVEADGMVEPVAPHQGELGTDEGERQKLIAYGRSCGLDEASTLYSRMAYDAYYPLGSRFKYFTPKTQARLGNLLIKAANAIASLPDGPYDRFKARQQKKAGTSAVA